MPIQIVDLGVDLSGRVCMMGRKILAIGILAGIGVACDGGGSKSRDEGSSNSGAWTNTAMQQLVANKCATAGCHGSGKSPNYAGISESNMKADKNALNQVKAGKMPPTGALTGTDLSTFVNFYQ